MGDLLCYCACGDECDVWSSVVSDLLCYVSGGGRDMWSVVVCGMKVLGGCGVCYARGEGVEMLMWLRRRNAPEIGQY